MENPYQDLRAILASLAEVQHINQSLKNDYTLLRLEVEEFLDHRAKGLIMGEECYEIEHLLFDHLDRLNRDAQAAIIAATEGDPTEENLKRHRLKMLRKNHPSLQSLNQSRSWQRVSESSPLEEAELESSTEVIFLRICLNSPFSGTCPY